MQGRVPMSRMLDRGDHDELLTDCPWNNPDAEYCDAHDRELSWGEDEEGNDFRYCKVCEEINNEYMGIMDVKDMWK